MSDQRHAVDAVMAGDEPDRGRELAACVGGAAERGTGLGRRSHLGISIGQGSEAVKVEAPAMEAGRGEFVAP